MKVAKNAVNDKTIERPARKIAMFDGSSDPAPAEEKPSEEKPAEEQPTAEQPAGQQPEESSEDQ